MNSDFSLQGAWINPNAEIFWTKNIQSHQKVIEELGIKKYLQNIQQKNNWNNYDLSQVAMKSGFIRVTNYKNQFGIEYGSKPTFKQILSILRVLENLKQDLWKNAREKIDFLTIEKFISGEHQSFSNCDDFSKALNKIQGI